jgi:hypothetical protein
MLGRIEEANCSLFHAVERIAEVSAGLFEHWDSRFAGHSAEEIFAWLDAVLYSGEIDEADEDSVCRFDFLTNTGEQFDGFKSFIYCQPGGVVCIPYQGPDGILQTPRCSAEDFQAAASELQRWFHEHVST